MASSTTSNSSKVRDLVRSVVNEVQLVPGEFADEAMRTFFAEIKGLVNGAFNALYEEVQVAGADTKWREEAMMRGLQFMNDPQNETRIIDSVVESEDACRSLTKQYFRAMYAFAQETLSKKHDLLRVNFVPFGTFIARLYRKLAGVAEMKTRYFDGSMSYTEKDTLLRDVLRQVMHASIVLPGSAATSIAPPVPSFAAPITPNDSVSNISRRTGGAASAAGSRVGQSVANTVLTVVRDEIALSPETLSTHNEKTSQGGGIHESRSRFSGFTPASVTGGRRDKVVVVSDADAHTLPRGARASASRTGSSTSHMTVNEDGEE